MPNKSINQMPSLLSLQDGDLLYAVRSSTDYKVDAATFAGRVQAFETLIPSADVLTIGNTPVNVVPAPTASQVIVPLMVFFKYESGTTDYVSTGDLVLINAAAGATYGTAIGMGSTAGDGNTMTMTGDLLDAGAGLFLCTSDVADPTTGDYDLRVIVYYTIANA